MMEATSPRTTNEDEGVLLGLFPAEVWIMVFDKLDEPNNLKNCSNASTIFRNLLLPKMTYFLFSEVLEVMLANDGLDLKNSVSLCDAEISYESLVGDWMEMQLDWEYFESDENQTHDGDLGLNEAKAANREDWKQLKGGWSDIELAWNNVGETLENIRYGNQIATFGWNRKIELWSDGIKIGWDEMHTFLKMMKSNERDINERGVGVDIVRNNMVKMERITTSTNKWNDTIRILSLVCDEWNKAIGNWPVLDLSTESVETSENEWSGGSDDESEENLF